MSIRIHEARLVDKIGNATGEFRLRAAVFYMDAHDSLPGAFLYNRVMLFSVEIHQRNDYFFMAEHSCTIVDHGGI